MMRARNCKRPLSRSKSCNDLPIAVQYSSGGVESVNSVTTPKELPQNMSMSSPRNDQPIIWTKEFLNYFIEGCLKEVREKSCANKRNFNEAFFSRLAKYISRKSGVNISESDVNRKYASLVLLWERFKDSFERGSSDINWEKSVIEAERDEKLVEVQLCSSSHNMLKEIINYIREGGHLTSRSLGKRRSRGTVSKDTYVQQTHGVSDCLSLLTELRNTSVKIHEDPFLVAMQALQCPNYRKMYSLAATNEEKLLFLNRIKYLIKDKPMIKPN